MFDIPFRNLAAAHRQLEAELTEVISEVIASGVYAGGPRVESFEREFASYCGSHCCVGLSSGTDALWLALLAVGVGAGDEVITVPSTFMATVEAIRRTGAKPVFVDVDSDSWTMNPGLLRGAITERTKAILPVHLFGRMAAMWEIMEVADQFGIPVIEDAAQAHGAEYNGGAAGTWGRIGCFSFYPGKNLGGIGEAGAIVTDDSALAARIAALRNHGQSRRSVHEEMGWNCRMDAIQAAVLSVKLRMLDGWNEKRRFVAMRYTEVFQRVSGIVTPAPSGSDHAHHLYVIKVENRDEFIDSLAKSGIECGVHYPVPAHLQPCCTDLGYRPGDFPVSEELAARCVSLPMHADLTHADVEKVISTVVSTVLRRRAA